MTYFLYGLFFVSCVILIASVLLQPGKTDAGALFTSNISSTAFQPRGSQSILSKITIVAASVFMLSALLLAMPALTGSVSVLDTVGETPAETMPVVEANTNTDTNANTAVDANTAANANNLPTNVIVVTNTNAVNGTIDNANTSANTTSNANTANANQ